MENKVANMCCDKIVLWENAEERHWNQVRHLRGDLWADSQRRQRFWVDTKVLSSWGVLTGQYTVLLSLSPEFRVDWQADARVKKWKCKKMSAWPLIKLFAKSDLSICPNGFAKSSSLKLPERDMLSPASVAAPKCRTLKRFTASDDPRDDRTGLPRVASLGVLLTAALGGMARESSDASAGLGAGSWLWPFGFPEWILTSCGAFSPHPLSLQQDSLTSHSTARAEEMEAVRPFKDKT